MIKFLKINMKNEKEKYITNIKMEKENKKEIEKEKPGQKLPKTDLVASGGLQNRRATLSFTYNNLHVPAHSRTTTTYMGVYLLSAATPNSKKAAAPSGRHARFFVILYIFFPFLSWFIFHIILNIYKYKTQFR